MTTPRFHFVGLVASDMAATLGFYRKLGLAIPPEADGEPHVEFTTPEGMLLAWDAATTVQSFDSSWTPPSGSPRMGLAFDYGEPAAVDKAYADLVAEGYHGHLPPFDAFWGQRYAVVHDPDGNSVDLFAALP